MASLALGLVGGFFGGPLGFAIGSFVGNLLFPQKGPDGPTLTNLKLTNSAYGQMIPILYGEMPSAGNVIYSTDLIPHKHTSGGKGGPEQTTTSYSATFAMYLCEGPIASVNRVWADGVLIWNADGSVGSSFPFTLYIGDELQMPDPAMEAILGVGFVPAYRGIAYVVADDMDLTQYGNRNPVWKFEVVTSGNAGSLHIVAQNPNAFSSVPGNIFGNYTVIYRWSDTATIQIGIPFHDTGNGLAPGVQSAFDPTALTATTTSGLITQYPNYWSGPSPQYQPIGFYVYANGNSTPLWLSIASASSPITAQDITIVTNTVVTNYQNGIYVPSDPANFLFNAGIPVGYYVMGCCLTGDGTSLFVFTSTGFNGSGVRAWWQIKDGLNTLAGSLDANFPAFTSGATPVASAGSVSAENNGQYFWSYSTSSNTAQVWQIDSSLHLGPVSGMSLQVGVGVGGSGGSILSYKNGYAGLSIGTGLYLLSRLSPTQNTVTLGQILADLSSRAGLSPSQIDVSQQTQIVPGYEIDQQQAVKDSITPLQSAYYVDAVESSGVIRFVNRGANPIVTIPDGDLAAVVTGSQPPALVTVKRVQEVDLPQSVSVAYVNAAADYQVGNQLSQRTCTESQLAMAVQLSISLSDSKAKEVSNTLLFTAWLERNQFTLLVSRQYAYLEPTDVIIAHGYELRIMSKSDVASNVIQLDGVATLSSIWTSSSPVAGTNTSFTPTTPTSGQPAALTLLDIPLIVDTDSSDGLYAAMAGSVSPSWSGASLYQSTDGGDTFDIVATTAIPAVMGTVTGLPTAAFMGGNTFDETSVFTVTIGPGGGELSSANQLAVLNGANMVLCGSELMQYKNATLISAGVYQLSGLLRGRRGTEWAMTQHALTERFAVCSTVVDVAESFAQLGQTLEYEAVSFGTALTPASAMPFVNTGNAALPYSPVQLGGGTDGSGNVTLNWIRRTRIGGAWVNYVDVPLSEAVEQYVVQIWDSTYSNCARIALVSTPTFLYTSSMQVTDFGSTQATVFFSVGQIGAYKLGVQAFGKAVGAGASNTAVVAPVAPYNTGPSPPATSGCTVPTIPALLSWANGSTANPQNVPPTQELVISFTTGASVIAGQGSISLLCTAGAMTAGLSTSPCGAPLAAQASQTSSSIFLPYYMTGNPDTSQYPTLAINTTYYVSVSVSVLCNILATLYLPS